MKKRVLLITLLLSCNFNILSKKKPPYHVLKSDLIEFLDGKPGALGGNAILEMLQVRTMIKNLKEKGVVDSHSKEVLLYQNKPCSISNIAGRENNVPKNCPELAKCLKEAKQKFIKTTIGFMRRIKHVKKEIIGLMKESCSVRNIKEKDTILLEWANTENNEEAVFNDRIKTFKEFDKFLGHVFNFLGDLLTSCPKGLEQYKQKYGKRDGSQLEDSEKENII